MVRWLRTDGIHFGVAISTFPASNTHHLNLNFGQSVLIFEQTDDAQWYRGCVLGNKKVSGIFPVTHVEKKWTVDCPHQGKVDRQMMFGSSNLLSAVEEVTLVLNEWQVNWKELFAQNKSEEVQEVHTLLDELMAQRRRVMSHVLTSDQLKQFRLEIANTIDYGNQYLNLDLVVRDNDGAIIDVDSTGVIELYKRHLQPDERGEIVGFNGRRTHSRSNANQHNLHNLFVSVKNVVSKVGDDSDVIVTLYDGNENVFVSEHYVVGWDKNGTPKDLDKLQNLTCLFTDLGQQDMGREKLYLVCQVIKDGATDSRGNAQAKLRRPFGIAVVHVSDIVTGKREKELDKEIFVPLVAMGSDDVETAIRKVVGRVQAPPVQGTGQGIWLNMMMMHGDMNHIREEHSLQINQYTAFARKQGFPDVIMPGDVRNDLYLTLVSANFDRGTKAANKMNVQVLVGVYDSAGCLIPNVVSMGAGEPMVSEHISTVYMHNPNPKWNEVVKLSIPVEQVDGFTIRFLFRHRPVLEDKTLVKVHSAAYVNLVGPDGTCLQDGVHELAVYKYEGKKSGDGDDSYLKMPSLKSHISIGKKAMSNGNFTYNKAESFRISTKLCSTKLAQNVDLLGLLRWKTQKEKLGMILPRLTNVSGDEIVKFLQETFDALFSILGHDSTNFGTMVSDAIVFCIGLLADRKYSNFRPILDRYIENLFSSTNAYVIMLESLQRNLDRAEALGSGNQNETAKQKAERKDSLNLDAGRGDSQAQVKKYFKAVEYFMKFIVRSRVLSESATPGVGNQQFADSIHKFFQTVINIMKSTNQVLLIIQGCALKYIPSVFGDLLNVYDPVSLGNYALEMIQCIPPDRLLPQKINCIWHMVRSPLFHNQRSRKVLLPMVVSQLQHNMKKGLELQVCAEVLNEILSSFVRTDMGETDDDIEYIALNLFRNIVQMVFDIYQDESNSMIKNFVAIIVAVLDLMKEHHYASYVNSYQNDLELLDSLVELFLVFREFVKGKIYPTEWVLMSMVQNNVILGALQNLSNCALSGRFLVGDSFQAQLWIQFFQDSVAFTTQPSLQLEEFSPGKRRSILEQYSDMRMTMANTIIDMWHHIGKHKIDLMISVVRPFLEMTLIPETNIRNRTIPVFYDMISCEYRNRGHFKQVESEIIMQLDDLIETGMKGDEEYKNLFSHILLSLFEDIKSNDPRLYELGVASVETINKLLTRLLDYRSVISSEDNIHNRMSCNVNILNFYKDIKREEMTERYLYKLCDLHLNVKSYTEAAFTLLQHAELLKFGEDPLHNSNSNFSSHRYDGVTTEGELKEKLYVDIIEYFDKGEMWEYGIKRCKELADHYEQQSYEYDKLSKILSKQAHFFENIIKAVVRPEPTYFRVGYYGRGFPTFLRNKLFIQRGDKLEKLSDFSMRMRTLFPAAQFLNTLEQPGTDITESLKQWIQICKVDAKPVLRRKFQGKNIAEQIKKFYEVNDVSEFILNRPFHRGTRDKDNEFATLWIERITMNTEFSFPGKLRWFEVHSITRKELSPIENAVDTMRQKNKELATLISQHSSDLNLNYNNLSMVLNGTIDAAVMGGYANYEKIFFSKEYMAAHPDETIFTDILKESIVEQVDLCEKGLEIHKKVISKELAPFHQKMEQQLKQNKAKALPYRKEDRRKAFSGGDKKVFPGRMKDLKAEHTKSNPRLDSTAPPIPPSRRTMMENLTMPGKRNSGHRHTAIIGSSTLAEDYLYDGGDFDALPREEQERVMTMTLGRKPKKAPAQSKLVSSASAGNVASTESPPIPRKLKKNMSTPTVPPISDHPKEEVAEDDEPPPLLPKKKRNNNNINNNNNIINDNNDSNNNDNNTNPITSNNPGYEALIPFEGDNNSVPVIPPKAPTIVPLVESEDPTEQPVIPPKAPTIVPLAESKDPTEQPVIPPKAPTIVPLAESEDSTEQSPVVLRNSKPSSPAGYRKTPPTIPPPFEGHVNGSSPMLERKMTQTNIEDNQALDTEAGNGSDLITGYSSTAGNADEENDGDVAINRGWCCITPSKTSSTNFGTTKHPNTTTMRTIQNDSKRICNIQ